MPQSLSYYLEGVKKTLIVSFVQQYLNQLSADALVDTLDIIFRRKAKTMHHIALYVQREVEQRGKPLDVTLQNIAFFSIVLKDYINMANGKPLNR